MSYVNRMSNMGKWIAITFALLAPFFIYLSTVQSIVGIWNTSETFAHGYIIAPISLWLIWRRRDVITSMSAKPFWPALILLAACGFGWLLADLAEVGVVKQYMFVAIIPVSIVFLLGVKISWAMAFPLFFLILAVPFGEVFIAPLIDFTADFTVAALQMTGIPVLRDGTTFAIPSGNWSVVEACSGVRYLISSFTLGCLYAYLTYQSLSKRILFIAFSIIVPIIANGIRAYMIVMIGHLSSMQLAVGFDHLIYGWLFFGLVMFLMFWVGSFWRDPVDLPLVNADATSKYIEHKTTSVQVIVAAVSAIICISIWPVYANYLEKAGANPLNANVKNLQSSWQSIQTFTTWQLGFMPANAEVDNFYQNQTKKIGVSIRYYRNQNRESSLFSSSNQLVASTDAVWHQTSSIVRHESSVVQGADVDVIESKLRDGAGRNILVWHWYRIDDRFIINPYIGKILQAREKLFSNSDDGAAIVLYASYIDHEDDARLVMKEFLRDNSKQLNAVISQNKKY